MISEPSLSRHVHQSFPPVPGVPLLADPRLLFSADVTRHALILGMKRHRRRHRCQEHRLFAQASDLRREKEKAAVHGDALAIVHFKKVAKRGMSGAWSL